MNAVAFVAVVTTVGRMVHVAAPNRHCQTQLKWPCALSDLISSMPLVIPFHLCISQ